MNYKYRFIIEETQQSTYYNIDSKQYKFCYKIQLLKDDNKWITVAHGYGLNEEDCIKKAKINLAIIQG